MPKLSPVGVQNGHYIGNEKRYDPKSMLCPHKCGHSAWGYYLVQITGFSNCAQRAAKIAFLDNILGMERDTTL